MDANALYRALVSKPITAQRLRKAQKRADTPEVYQTVFDRLVTEGKVTP